jgi:hypothetical protein
MQITSYLHMTFNNQRSGPNNTAEYMASGLPWVTSSVLSTAVARIDFPYVTNNIYLHVSGGSPGSSARLAFTSNGFNVGNYVEVGTNEGWTEFNVRCKTIFLRATAGTVPYSLFAGLTTIAAEAFPVLTGSAYYNSASIANEFGYGMSGSQAFGTGLG